MIITSLMMFIFCTQVISQNTLKIEGFVKEMKNSKPMIGTTILIKGTTTGTICDLDGRFILNVPARQTALIFSYVGEKTLETQVMNFEPGKKYLFEVYLGRKNSDYKLTVDGYVVTAFSNPKNLPEGARGSSASNRSGAAPITMQPAARENTAVPSEPETIIIPPILTIVPGSVRFIEPGGNHSLDAGESCKISFTLENSGRGDGRNLVLEANAHGDFVGISFQDAPDLNAPVESHGSNSKIESVASLTLKIGELRAGQKKDIEIPVSANLNNLDGLVSISFKINEPNGFGTDMETLEINTLKFASPMVEVVDYSVTGGKGGALVRKYPFDLQVLLQNTQYGKAEDVSVTLTLPHNVLLLSANSASTFPSMKPGETKSIVYNLIVNDLYSADNIPVNLKLHEKYGRYAKDRSFTLQINQVVASNKIVVDGTRPNPELQKIEIASINNPVDKNIPAGATTHSNRYALIIGNEDYSSKQPGLSREINVDYAGNDARIFREYAINTLGVPDRQAKLIIDATAAEIRRELSWISSLAKLENGNAELIFYYSGHGLPDENTHEPYLIPVDVSGTNISEGIKLSDVYKKLNEFPGKRVTVFLDACFSGGGRNQGLLAAKSVKIRPKDDMIQGNMVVFTSSSGEESSGVDRDKQHGYFTWFLLKKLQESKGEVTYKTMSDYLRQGVSRETTLGGKPQTPKVLVSNEVESTWESWTFK